MMRHPHDGNMPWDAFWRQEAGVRHHWWFIALLIMAALLFIGVRPTGGFWLGR
jgi:hypothetical protein